MALSIVNNPLSIGAQGSVNGAQGSLSKTIKSLSTGLRINSAADDASGLAVSEKLRSQISGLSKAATNAQDAISMLQTAEGAMGSMNSMVQRIRELAVQAGDPAYTANDRAMLQLEVDQLKEEIDRVSTSTEFNTKKLLNGDAAAIWTSSSSDLEAIVKGAAVEGNYKINYSVEPGQNSVYKTNIFSLANGNKPLKISDNNPSNVNNASFRGVTISDGDTISISTSGSATKGQIVNLAGSDNTERISISGGSSAYFVEINGKNATIRDSSTGKVLATQVLDSQTAVYSIKVGDATITISGGATNQNGVTGVMGMNVLTSSKTIQTTTNPGQYGVFGIAGDNKNEFETTIVQWDADTNTATYGTITLNFGASTSAYGTFTVEASKYVDKNTKLSQLAQFTNSDGRMVLDNTQELSLYAGNGERVTITLEGSDTIQDLENKLNVAMQDLGLGSGSNMVQYVDTTASNSNGAVPGTMIIQGMVLGDDSNLTFVGDEAVLKGLGVTQIQKATDSQMSVTVVDAHTGRAIGGDTVTDGVLRGIIPGVDLEIDVTSALKPVTFDSTSFSMKFEPLDATKEIMLHIKDTSTKAAIGANEGQTLDLSIGRLDTKSLEITDVNVATFEDAQRSITQLDMAIEKINKARSTAGAQMNRLEYTINNLNTTRENMTAAESRIRDLDIAQASSSLAAQQVLMQSASAMLAQANQMPSYAMQLIG